MLAPLKYLVLSWTSTAATIVSIVHNVDAAIAAAQAVSLSGGTIGAGYCPINGSEVMTLVQGVNET